jgi:hypothetical protein
MDDHHQCPDDRPRRLYLHIGLHKTGTTAIQRHLSGHQDVLLAAQKLYPSTGRLSSKHPGHHNIAWAFSGDYRYRQGLGGVDDLIAEISDWRGDVILSSEDFVSLACQSSRLEAFLDRLVGCCFSVVLILVLRGQVDLAFSCYCEFVGRHQLSRGLGEVLEEICTTGALRYRGWHLPFDFLRLLGILRSFPMAIRVISFDQVARDGCLIPSLLHCMDLDPKIFAPGKVENQSMPMWDLVRAHHRNHCGILTRSARMLLRSAETACPSVPRFTASEVSKLYRAFHASNAWVERDWNVKLDLPSAPGHIDGEGLTASSLFNDEFQRMLKAMADRDWTSRLQRRWHSWSS